MQKYQNIFWHQGVKFFDDTDIKDKKTLLEIDHFENDVTKCFLNVLQHCDPIVIHAIMDLINQKNKSNIVLKSTIRYEFQIKSKQKFRTHPIQFLLRIISTLTPLNSTGPDILSEFSIPDGAIYDTNTVLLFEAKTQSPLLNTQIKNHIANYVPQATEITLYWEDIFDTLVVLQDKLNEKDRFLVNHFCAYLDIISLSNFHKFSEEDFQAFAHPKLGGIYEEEERLQRLRKINRKLQKLDKILWPRLEYKDKKIGRVKKNIEYLWFGYYPLEPLTKWVNLNFFIGKLGFHIVANAEKKDTFSKLIKRIEKFPDKFDLMIHDIGLDCNILLYTQLPLQPESADNFYLKKVSSIPKKEITSKRILQEINMIQKSLDSHKVVMFEEIKKNPLTNTQSNIDYVSKTFFGVKPQKMYLESKCILRFNFLIPRKTIVNLEREQLIAKIVDGANEMRKIVDFANDVI
jgi:hypothetical protein